MNRGDYSAAVLIDLMVPAFGDDALVREMVDSVFAQDDPNWRLTAIDDGPAAGRAAGLGEWLAQAAPGDDRVRYRANPTRLGINRNFQSCVKTAEGDLVVLLGADDRLLPDFVSTLRRTAAAHPDVAFVHTGARVIDAAGRPTQPLVDRVKRAISIRPAKGSGTKLAGGERLAASLLRGNWMYFPSVAFRRDWLVAHGFREGYDVVQDLDLYLRILRAGGKAALLERPGIEYRRHPGSLSSTGAKDGSRFVEERRFFTETALELTDAGWPVAARAARLHLTSRLHQLCAVPELVAAGQHRAAGSLLRHALRALPVPVRTTEGAPA